MNDSPNFPENPETSPNASENVVAQNCSIDPASRPIPVSESNPSSPESETNRGPEISPSIGSELKLNNEAKFESASDPVASNENEASESEDEFEASDLAFPPDSPIEGSQSLAEALEKYQIQEKYSLRLSAKKIRLLEEYCHELWSLNHSLNLTRHTTFDKFVSRDLIDAIELSSLLQKGEHILDVGTGGGVPGIPLAILRPDLVVELCDSTGKKAEAVGSILDELDLDLNVWYAKAEDLVKVHRFHTLVVRAVSKMEKLLRAFAPLWFAFDRILMVKGPHWVEERGEARRYNLLDNLALRKLAEYPNPDEPFDSVILQVCQKKRFEELEKRNQERLEGKPIGKLVETVGIDNKNRTFDSSKKSRFSAKPGDSSKKPRFSAKPGDSSKKTNASDRKGGDSSKRSSSSKKFGRFGKTSSKSDSQSFPKRGKGWVDKDSPFKSPKKRNPPERPNSPERSND